jgi:hypothetical protein
MARCLKGGSSPSLGVGLGRRRVPIGVYATSAKLMLDINVELC